jgi:hypothetical protein
MSQKRHLLLYLSPQVSECQHIHLWLCLLSSHLRAITTHHMPPVPERQVISPAVLNLNLYNSIRMDILQEVHSRMVNNINSISSTRMGYLLRNSLNNFNRMTLIRLSHQRVHRVNGLLHNGTLAVSRRTRHTRRHHFLIQVASRSLPAHTRPRSMRVTLLHNPCPPLFLQVSMQFFIPPSVFAPTFGCRSRWKRSTQTTGQQLHAPASIPVSTTSAGPVS